MEKESKKGFLNRIILSEKEENNSFSQENEYDLQYMINDFLQENTNNNINNNIKIIQNKYNIYNINSSKNYEYKNNKKEAENEKNGSISIDFSQIKEERDIYDKIVEKNCRKTNLKKILAHKNSISVNSEKNCSELSVLSNDLNNENYGFERAKSLINRNKKDNHSFKKYSILKLEDNLKNNKYVRIRNKADNKKYEKIKQIMNINCQNYKDKKIDIKNIFNQLKILQNILNKLFNTQHENEIKEQKNYMDLNHSKMIENYSTKNSSNITSNLFIKKGKEERILNLKINNLPKQLLKIINSGKKENLDSNIFIEVLKLLFSCNNFNKNNKYNSSNYKKELSQKNVKELIEKYSNCKNDLNKNKKNDSIKINKNLKIKDKDKINVTEINITQFKDNKKFINILDASNEKNHDFLYRRQKIKKSKNKDSESQECSFQPKINKTYFIKRNKTLERNISKNSKIEVKENKTNIVSNNRIPIYEKLYRQDKEKKDKMKKLIKEKLIKEEIKELGECTFKPNIISNTSYAKSFNINNNNLPKGYNEYKYKLRKVIADEQKRKIEENK